MDQTAGKLEVAAVQRAEYDVLARFLAQFPGETRSAAHWQARFRAWWDDNPAFSDDVERGWLLRHAGTIVGFMGTIPWKFQFNGVVTIAFGGTTWRVLPAFRGGSMALKTRQRQVQQNALQFSTTPAPKLAGLLGLLGYQPLSRFQDTTTQSMVLLDAGKLLQRKLGLTAARLVAPLANWWQQARLRRLNRGGCTVRQLARADSAFDELWERTRTLYLHTNVRDAAAVNWYCFASPAATKTLLGCYQEGRLTGFMILMPEDMAGEQVFTCLDLWLDLHTASHCLVAASLIAEAAQIARAQGMQRVLLPHFNKKLAGILCGLPLIVRPAWTKREFLGGPPAMLAQITPENAYFVGAQGDTGL